MMSVKGDSYKDSDRTSNLILREDVEDRGCPEAKCLKTHILCALFF